jgi:hypothetical protein
VAPRLINRESGAILTAHRNMVFNVSATTLSTTAVLLQQIQQIATYNVLEIKHKPAEEETEYLSFPCKNLRQSQFPIMFQR